MQLVIFLIFPIPIVLIVFTYDRLNRQTRVDNFGTPTSPHVILSYGYDANGNRIFTRDNSGVEVNAFYDQRNRLMGKTWDGPHIDPARIDFSYDDCGCGRKTLVERYADISGIQLVGSSRFNYDTLGRVETIRHSDGSNMEISEFTFSYDKANQITQKIHHDENI